MRIKYGDLPWPAYPCRRVGIGMCHVAKDRKERGVYFARARHRASASCSLHAIETEGLFTPQRCNPPPAKYSGYSALGGMPALLHSCREERRVVLEDWKRMVRAKYETPNEYTRDIGKQDWRSDNRVHYEAHVAIINGLLEDLKRAEG